MTVGRLPDLFTGAFAAALVLALLGDSALAADADHAHHAASITFSPLHLLQPFLQVTGELRLDDKIGAAAILGAGQVSEDSRRYGAWEVGGQFRYYLFGSFVHGMTLGAEVGYLHVPGRLEHPMDYCAGVRFGAFAGYKIATKVGFTFDAQLGDKYVVPSTGNSEHQPIMNFTVGWSF
jgi:hypothetical protein